MPLEERASQNRHISRKAIPDDDVAEIRRSSAEALLIDVGGAINRKIDELLPRQTPTVTVPKLELQRFSVDYFAALQKAAGDFAKKLAQAVGTRGDLGNREHAWIEEQVRQFINSRTTPEAAKTLFQESFGMVTVTDEQKIEDEFVNCVTIATDNPRLLRDARKELALARALYGKRRTSVVRRSGAEGPTPGEKVANPVLYPTLTVAETMELFGKSHSTIYRWGGEGKLRRASMGKKGDKRTSCLILTQSAKELLEESAE